MKFTTKHISFYLPITLLGFLIVKIMVGGILLYMKSSVFPVPVLDSMPALAEDANSHLPSPATLSSQNLRENAEALERKRADIEMERRQLEREREQLAALKQEIQAKVATLSEIQNRIQKQLDEQRIILDNKIKHLIKIYTTMAPKKAAVLIEKLDMEIIIELFSTMKGEHVGQILPHVSAEKAAKISERLARQK